MNEEYIVTVNPKKINFMPENEVVEILQNVYTILSTTQFSVPLTGNSNECCLFR